MPPMRMGGVKSVNSTKEGGAVRQHRVVRSGVNASKDVVDARRAGHANVEHRPKHQHSRVRPRADNSESPVGELHQSSDNGRTGAGGTHSMIGRTTPALIASARTSRSSAPKATARDISNSQATHSPPWSSRTRAS